MAKPTSLSKSKLKSARQCLKRLHLEIHNSSCARVSAATEARLRMGRAVGAMARRLYGTDLSVLVPHAAGLTGALAETSVLLQRTPRAPIFEATVEHEGVLVRIDVLLPHEDGWRIVEVKASSSVKEDHAFDCAVQAWVFLGAGHRLTGTSLAHVDTGFEYAGDGDYRGLLKEVDLAAELDALLPSIPDWLALARAAAGPAVPDVPVGAHCGRPYDCPFIDYCWPGGAEFPVQYLPRTTKARQAEWIALGYEDLRDVPTALLTAAQRRVQRITRNGKPALSPEAAAWARDLAYPRYFLDFETVAPAIPIWPGTRPYQVLPFQWSCHYQPQPTVTEHAEFLDLTGAPPMRRLAESLIRALGRNGPVLTYTNYEARVIEGLRQSFPDLAPALQGILARLVDLAPVCRENFYAPSMAGSWSLKAILPAIRAETRYDELVGIQEGTAASEGYLEAIDKSTDGARKAELNAQLLRYCRMDTEAMVQLLTFLARGEAPT